MKKRVYFLAPVLFFACTLTTFAQDAEMQDSTAMKDDSSKSQEFIKTAASGGMMEVQLGQMAMEKASSEAVKQFGETMVDDHSMANEELKALASSNDFMVPDSMMDKHQKTIDKLSSLEGEKFDKEYMKTMVKDHKKDISEFEKAAKNAENSELQAWAKKKVDVLKQHLQMAEDAQQSVQASAN